MVGEKPPIAAIAHYGTKRHSGRYPWGSGETPYQHESWFVAKIRELREKENYTDKELADYFDMSLREFVRQKGLATQVVRDQNRTRAIELYNKGMSKSAIAREMGLNESVVRTYLKSTENNRAARIDKAADIIDAEVQKGYFVDIGEGVALGMGMNQTQFDMAVQKLKNEKGYSEVTLYVKQVTDKNHSTTVKVLCPPGTTRKDILNDLGNVHLINEKFEDQTGVNMYGLEPIKSISSKKIEVCYAEDGGSNKDGVIEIRRGAEGLDLGGAHYAQVRIGVDGTHYLKGMAVYADDLPDGVDIRFNTSKHKGTPKMDAFKEMGDDADNPFGAQIKPGGQRGYLNIVTEEGEWSEWSKTLSSQFLSKQPDKLAKQQLDLARKERDAEFEEIRGLTNPTLRRHMLEQFADKCDTASVSLKAAAMPGQATHVILPLTNLRDNEIYAPGYNNGDRVILIRYPHAGLFEIPELVVNNNNPQGKKLLGVTSDAVGISPKTAAQLSGADFDGDTVVVIPNNHGAINTSRAIDELIAFEPKESYKATASTKHIYVKGDDGKMVPSEKTITKKNKNTQMGIASNLIADMTVKHADRDELIRAVKYSMVVIDSEKHNLDWKQAYDDFRIADLQRKYQNKGIDPKTGKERSGGATTLITRAKSETRVPKVTQDWKPNPETGEITYHPAKDRYWTDKEGKTHTRSSKFPAMVMRPDGTPVRDARELSSGSSIEGIYADYANYMKALANRARKEAMVTKDIAYVPSAAKTYAKEVASLKSKVNAAKAHSPKERKAQLLANLEVQLKEDSMGELEPDQIKKIKRQTLARARAALGGSRPAVEITDREWTAIQSGACRKTLVEDVFKYTNQDALKKRAMPHETPGLTPGQLALVDARLAAGYTQAEVAAMLGVSPSTISRAVHA